MTDTPEAPADELTIEEQARAVLAAALDQISNLVPGGKVRWSITTLPIMLAPVLIDLGRHLQKPMPPMPKLPHVEPSAEAVRRRKLRCEEEQRYRWTGDELAEAMREDM